MLNEFKSKSKRQNLCFVYKIMHNFKVGFLLNAFLNQTFILAVFNAMFQKWFFFQSILTSTTQGSLHRDFIKHLFIIIYSDLNSDYPYTPCGNSPGKKFTKLFKKRI